MTKSIKGVPESITRQQYVDLINSLGIDPYLLYDLWFGRNTIVATVKALDENGKGYAGEERNEMAKHNIVIKVVDS
jgi:hypothetical protein